MKKNPMRITLLMVIFVTLIIGSCKKDNTNGTGKTVPRCVGALTMAEQYSISGPNYLCLTNNNQTATYTIPELTSVPDPLITFINWSIDQPSVASISSYNNGRSATVTRLTSGTFKIKVNMHVGSLCNEAGWLNDKSVESCGTNFNVIVSNPNPSAGYMPSINFFNTVNGQNEFFKTFYSSYNYMSVGSGTYNLVITQTNNKPLTVSMSGYPTKTGATVTYDNVSVSGYFPTIMINNPTQ